eukprot:6191243-Pleurochrysis_carterae.AAC.1
MASRQWPGDKYVEFQHLLRGDGSASGLRRFGRRCAGELSGDLGCPVCFARDACVCRRRTVGVHTGFRARSCALVVADAYPRVRARCARAHTRRCRREWARVRVRAHAREWARACV